MPCSMGWDRSTIRDIRARLSRLLAVPPQPPEKLDLTRVVDVVRSDAVDERVRPTLASGRLGAEGRRGQSRHRFSQTPVHVVEESEVRAPGALRRRHRTDEPIAPLLAERTSFLVDQHAPDGVLPVRGVERELPDVVPSRRRPPRGFSRADAAQGALEVRSLPRVLLVGLVEQPEQQGRFAHRRPPWARSGATFSSAGATARRAPCRMISATAATMTAAATRVRGLTVSPAKSQP